MIPPGNASSASSQTEDFHGALREAECIQQQACSEAATQSEGKETQFQQEEQQVVEKRE
jgi:hypothetical protein